MSKKNGLSIIDLFTLGFGAIVGVGWSVTLNNLMAAGGGPIPSGIGFIIATVFLIPIALCYAELTPMMPVAGGVMAYAYKAFGTKLSFIAGWFVALGYITILPWEAIAVNEIICFMFPALKSGIVLYTIAGTNIYFNALLIGLALSLVIIIINWFGTKYAARFQSILTGILIITVISCVVITLFKADISNVQPLYMEIEGKSHTSFWTGAIGVLALTPFYFVGFDTIPQGVEDAGYSVKPKSLGKVIIGALVSAGLLYVLILISSGLAYPWTETLVTQRPVLCNILKSIYGGVFGTIMFWVCLIGTLAGLFTTWNGFYIAGSRLLLGMGRASLLPKFFAKQNARTGIPVGGNISCAMLMCVGPFLGIGVIDPLTILTSVACVIGWLITCICVVRLRKKMPDLERPYCIPGGKIIPYIGIVFCVFMIVNCVFPGLPGYMGTLGIVLLLSWSLLGVVFYVGNRKNRIAVSEEARRALIFNKGFERQSNGQRIPTEGYTYGRKGLLPKAQYFLNKVNIRQYKLLQ